MRELLPYGSLLIAALPTAVMPQMTAGSAPRTAAAVAIPPVADATAHHLTVIDQSADSLFYVEAQVNGVPVQFVVDTGSSVVLLSTEDAQRAGVMGNRSIAVDTASGSSSMHRARIDEVVLAGRSLSGVDAMVSPGLKVSLLGQSALSQMGSVTIRERRLELE